MKLVCIGDSLTCGLGVEVSQIWTERIRCSTTIEVLNKGINGDTSGGMLARFWRDVINERPDKVIIMGGSNDFIAGCENAVVQANMMAMVHQARAAGIGVILGTAVPIDLSNIREDWRRFTDFEIVAQKHRQMKDWLSSFSHVFRVDLIDIYQVYQKQVQSGRGSFYIDGIHPNGKGHQIIAGAVLSSNVLW